MNIDLGLDALLEVGDGQLLGHAGAAVGRVQHEARLLQGAAVGTRGLEVIHDVAGLSIGDGGEQLIDAVSPGARGNQVDVAAFDLSDNPSKLALSDLGESFLKLGRHVGDRDHSSFLFS